jgi:hypothetical protein
MGYCLYKVCFNFAIPKSVVDDTQATVATMRMAFAFPGSMQLVQIFLIFHVDEAKN